MIFNQLQQQLVSLIEVLNKLSDSDFNCKIQHLSGATIGGHTRHIIELIHCAVNAHATGYVDYIHRNRNLKLETDRMFAISEIIQLEHKFRLPDKRLKMVVGDMEALYNNETETTYYREMIYNTEHCIHHLALIKVALIELNLPLVNPEFGMAYSTIKFKALQKND